jgi:hypothetical protein
MKDLRPLVFSLLPLTISVAFGQNGGGGVAGGIIGTQVRNAAGRTSGSMSFSPPPMIPAGVAGAPYSAEQTQEHVQTLNDGTHITQTQMRVKIYRDSLGRTRTERPLAMGFNDSDGPVVIQISDPVAGVQYTLDAQNKVAHRLAARSPGAGAVAPNGTRISGSPGLASTPPPVPPPPPPPGTAGVFSQAIGTGRVQGIATPPNFTEEKLPAQMIEGVLAEGVRRTNTIATGTQGNDRPFNIVSETWTSPDLKLTVLSKTDDPRNGESVMKLTNISRNEPDPTLFQPPADYQTVDETGMFTVRFGQQ